MPRRRRAGFTLVELLVVLGIVAILIGIVLPAFRSAREAARATHCLNNLRQIGVALSHYETAHGVLPAAGKGTRFNPDTGAPLGTRFAATTGLLTQVLVEADSESLFNAINFELDYNHASYVNFTPYSTRVSLFVCPTSSRPDRSPAGFLADPNDPGLARSGGQDYGPTDYGATCYTDIDPEGRTGGPGATAVVPYRNRQARAEGLLRAEPTRLAACIDGLTSTIVLAEVAGRNARFASGYDESYWDGSAPRVRPVPRGNRRSWRWGEPDSAIGVSGRINNPARPMCADRPFATPNPTAGNQAGANQEIFGYHRGGANVLFGDGSARLLRETTNVVVLRHLITAAGSEPVSDGPD